MSYDTYICSNWNEKIKVKYLYQLFQMCEKGHIRIRWSSQPKMAKQGVFSGDFLICAATLTSGNHAQKLALMASFAHLGWPNLSLFYRLQRLYFLPAIGQHYADMQSEVLSKAKGQNVIVGGNKQFHIVY